VLAGFHFSKRRPRDVFFFFCVFLFSRHLLTRGTLSTTSLLGISTAHLAVLQGTSPFFFLEKPFRPPGPAPKTLAFDRSGAREGGNRRSRANNRRRIPSSTLPPRHMLRLNIQTMCCRVRARSCTSSGHAAFAPAQRAQCHLFRNRGAKKTGGGAGSCRVSFIKRG